jgi:hypothetical protein
MNDDYSPDNPRFEIPELDDATKADLDKAMTFDFAGYGWSPPKAHDLDRLAIDDDFVSDVRGLLIDLANAFDASHWESWGGATDAPVNFDLAAWLTEQQRYINWSAREWPNSARPTMRFQDLRRAHDVICSLTRDDLSNLLMSHSLCPIHAVDWAICFDDEPEDCAQVRAIFPISHDT